MKEEIYPLTYQLEQDYWWYSGRRAIILSQIREFLAKSSAQRFQENRPCLLDYGCGTGLNLLCFSEIGDAYGLDASESALAFCHARGIENVALTCSDSPPEKKPFGRFFDVVTMLDVLEHIDDQHSTLERIRGYLAPGGALLVTVPAYESLWSGEDYVSNHLRRYTRESLVSVLEAAGYEVLRASYFNCFLFPAQAVSILCNRLFWPKTMYSSNLSVLSERINFTLRSIFSSESTWLRRFSFPFGGSIFCWCQPKSNIVKE